MIKGTQRNIFSSPPLVSSIHSMESKTPTETDDPASWGHLVLRDIQLAQEYLDAAQHLLKPPGEGGTRQNAIYNAPAYYLLAHGTELTLKCVAQWDGMTTKNTKKKFGHNLEKAWNHACQSSERSRELFSAAKTHVRDHWRKKLRAERDEYLKRTDGFDDSLTNSDIGNFASGICVASSISWLNTFAANGGALRYYKSSQMIQIPVIDLPWGQYPYLPDTVVSFSGFVLRQLENELRYALRDERAANM